MKRRKSLLVPIAALGGLACTSIAVAQENGGQQQYAVNQYPQTTEDDDILLPSDGPDEVPDDYDFFEVGDLEGDGDPDGLILAGGEAHALFAIDRFAHTERLGSGLTSARFELPAAPGGPQSILTSGSTGLVRHAFDAANGALLPPVPLKSGVAWQNVPILEPANLNNVGRSDLVVVTALQPNRVQMWKGTSSMNFNYLAHVDLPDAVQAVATLDWDGDGTTDVAMLSCTRLEIHSSVNGLLGSWTAPAAGGSLTRMPATAAQPGERLLWVRPASDVAHVHDDLLVLSSADPSPTPLKLEFKLTMSPIATAIDVTGLSVGDVDFDGDLDILIGHTSREGAVLLGNQGGATPLFSSGSTDCVVLDYGASPLVPAPDLTAVPRLTDLDGDGRTEILAAHDASESVVVEFGLPIFEPGVPVVIDPGLVGNLFHENRYGYDPGASLQVLGPLALLTVASSPVDTAGWTHVQVQVWEQTSPTVSLNPAALWNANILIPALQAGDVATQVAVHVDWGEPQYATWPTGRHLYFTVRFRKWDATEQAFVAKSQWWLQGLTLDDGTPNFGDHLLNHPFYLDSSGVLGWNGQHPSGGGGQPQTVVVGVAADLSRIGSFGGPPAVPGPEFFPPPPPATSPVGAFFWNQAYE